MPETLTPRQAANQLRRSAKAVVNRIEREERQVAQRALQRAIGLSSGPFSLQELAAMDHPYATRHPRAGLPPAIINVQSGIFRDSWQLESFRHGFTPYQPSVVFTIRNDTSYATFLKHGTQHMIRRPLDDALKSWWERERYNRVTAVLAKSGL
jgi:hypothetical protein